MSGLLSCWSPASLMTTRFGWCGSGRTATCSGSAGPRRPPPSLTQPPRAQVEVDVVAVLAVAVGVENRAHSAAGGVADVAQEAALVARALPSLRHRDDAAVRKLETAHVDGAAERVQAEAGRVALDAAAAVAAEVAHRHDRAVEAGARGGLDGRLEVGEGEQHGAAGLERRREADRGPAGGEDGRIDAAGPGRGRRPRLHDDG